MEIIRYISFLLSFFLIIGFFECLYKKVIKHTEDSLLKIGYDSAVSIFGHIKEKTIVLICFVSILTALFGNEGFISIIGVRSLTTMVNGRYCYYAVTTDADNYTNTIPVQIKVENDGIRKIIILEAACPIEDYVVYFYDDVIFPNQINNVTDENGLEWTIELTSNMAECKYLKYDNSIIKNAISSLIILFLQLLAALFYLLVAMKHDDKEKES